MAAAKRGVGLARQRLARTRILVLEASDELLAAGIRNPVRALWGCDSAHMTAKRSLPIDRPLPPHNPSFLVLWMAKAMAHPRGKSDNASSGSRGVVQSPHWGRPPPAFFLFPGYDY